MEVRDILKASWLLPPHQLLFFEFSEDLPIIMEVSRIFNFQKQPVEVLYKKRCS